MKPKGLHLIGALLAATCLNAAAPTPTQAPSPAPSTTPKPPLAPCAGLCADGVGQSFKRLRGR